MYVNIDDIDFEANKVRYIKCDSWDTFVKEIRKERILKADDGSGRWAHSILYRGHADPNWKLSSTLERNIRLDNVTSCDQNIEHLRKLNPDNWYNEICINLLNKFKYYAKGIDGFNQHQSDEEIWILGRHFGLLSPYLDWTQSPYVAAFFALWEINKRYEFSSHIKTQHENGEVHVWALRCWKDIQNDDFEILHLPPDFGTRMWAQSAIYTKLMSKDFIDLESYLINQGLGHFLECYILPYECADKALNDLAKMKITILSLFPDLEGAATQANIESELIKFGEIFNN